MELTGNSYWYVPVNRLGVPAEIWLLPSQAMRVVPDRQRFISGYIFRQCGVEEHFAPEEIIHLKYPSPESAYYGQGPLQAAAASVETHEALKEAERRGFENGVFPGVALQTAEKLSPETRKRLEESLRRGFAGPNRAGRALILEQGLTMRPFTYSPREMDFLDSGKVTRDEILAVFGVPAAVAGISEDVNRSSGESMLSTFAENTIMPKLKLLEAQLTQDLCRRFDQRIEARFDSPLPRARAEERADMVARIGNGITTPNEERRMLGLPPLADGDKLAAAAKLQAQTLPVATVIDENESGRQAQKPPRQEEAKPSRACEGIGEDYSDDEGLLQAALVDLRRIVRATLDGQASRVRLARRSGLSAEAALAKTVNDQEERSRLLAPLVPCLLPFAAGKDLTMRRRLAKEMASSLAEKILRLAKAEAEGFAAGQGAGSGAGSDAVAGFYAARVIPPALCLAEDAALQK